MWEQNYVPVAGSLVYSTLVAAIPLVILFYMLGVKRKPSWIAGLSALGAALVLAVAVFGMPVPQAGASMVYGAAFGLFPIGWIVIASLILYRVTLTRANSRSSKTRLARSAKTVVCRLY